MPFTPDPDKPKPSGFVADPEPTPAPMLPPDVGQDAWKAAVHGNMLEIPPGTAYQNRDEIGKQLRSVDGDYDSPDLDPTIYNDVAVGLESSIFGLHHREALPEEIKNPGMIDKFVTGLSTMVADLPFYVGGGLAGGAAGSEVPFVGNAIGAGAGAFAVPAAVREALVQGIKKGDVKSLPDLLRRAGAVTWAATKGALVGAATEASGGLAPTIGEGITGTIASGTVKGLYQATALTTAADLLEGKTPTANDFAGNAALILPLNLITHGLPLRAGEAKQATMDVYVKDGATPEETSTKLAAQPPVKSDLPRGLVPAIDIGVGHIEGDTDENHSDVAERVLGKKPVSMEQLEADPTKADKVLENPVIHEQDVIDRAWELKSEAVDAGEPYQYEPTDTSSPVSGTFYHGTKAPISSVTELDPGSHGNEQALYGIGTYLTDNPEVAKGYASTKGKGQTGNVLRAKVNNANLLDLEKPLPAEAHSVFEKAIQGITGDTEKIPSNLSGKELFRRLQEAMEDEGYPRSEAQDALGELTTELRQRGFEGLRHEGGGRVGSGPHNVAIIFPDYGVGRPTTDIVQDAEKPLTINDLYDRAAMKSGRGFVTPDGQFLSRMEARKWMKDNEPDTHEMWTSITQDKQAELHSEDYAEARNRVANRNLTEGEPDYKGMSPDLSQFLAENRSGILNKVKAGLESAKYGAETIRTLLVGPRNMLRAEGEQLVSRLRKLVPNSVDQEALHFLRDYRDDPAALQKAIEEVRSGDNERLKPFIPSMERALTPSPEMQQADEQMTQYFTKALDLGRQVGTMDSSIDPSRYSPRMFTQATEEAESGVRRPQFTEKTVHAIRREYLHTLDPLMSGDVAARTFNAFDELSVYSDRQAISISTKLFKTELKNSALGVEGTREDAPKGWVPLDSSARSFYVPKKIADAMAPLFKTADSQVAKFLHIQSIVKGIELTLSAFHMKALTVTAFNNMGLRDFTEAMHSDNSSPDFEAIEKRGALYGVTTTKTGPPVEAYKGLQPSSASPTGLLASLKDNAVTRTVDAAAKGITKTTFDVIQRKFKVMDFATKEAGWTGKHPEATPSEYAEAMRGYAKEVNAAYGGLNWDVMGVSKQMQSISRAFLLAPDWTFSNVANLKYAGEGGAGGNAARAFWVKSFTTGFAMTAAASIAIGGKYDPSDLKHMDQVYLGEDEHGKQMYANWFFAGAPKDAMNLVKRVSSDGPVAGMAEMIVSKLSPVASTVYGEAANKDYGSKPIYKKTDSTVAKTGKQVGYAAQKLLPITGVSAAETVGRALNDPDHEYSYRDILELAADAIGSQTVHEGAKETGKSAVAPGQKKRSQSVGKRKFSIKAGQ